MENKDKIEAQRIKENYITKEIQKTKLDELKELDSTVKKPVNIFSYTYGTVGSLVLGTGMTMAMGVIGGLMPLGIVIGLAGIAMVSSTYSIHKRVLNARKEKYAKQIISKSNEILNEQTNAPAYEVSKFTSGEKTQGLETESQRTERLKREYNASISSNKNNNNTYSR